MIRTSNDRSRQVAHVTCTRQPILSLHEEYWHIRLDCKAIIVPKTILLFLHSTQVAHKTVSRSLRIAGQSHNHDDVSVSSLSLLYMDPSLSVHSIACDPNAAADPLEQKMIGDGVPFRNRAQAVRLSMGHMLDSGQQKHIM